MNSDANDLLAFECPQCGWDMRTKRALAGTQALCPKCRERITIPDPA